jgi:hypothetical protein
VRFGLRCLGGRLTWGHTIDLAELRGDARHFTHLLALPPGDAAPPHRAAVRDISLSGCSMEADHLHPPGSRLTVRLYNPRRHVGRTHVLVVRHASRQDDGTVLLGCQFLRPLSAADLQELR